MKTKITLTALTIICLLSLQSLIAQIPVLEWAQQMGGTGFEEGKSIVVDDYGNIYTTGYFYGTVDFDPGIGTVNLTSNGSTDIFVLKLDPDGNLMWVGQMGGDEIDKGLSINLDASKNVIITGSFNGTVDFDPGESTVNLTSDGNADVFVQKLDSNGNFLWAKQVGGSNFDQGLSVAIDASGNIYTTGQFYGTVDFDPEVGTANLTSAGNYDIFILKLNPNGEFVWVKQMGGDGWDQGNSIALDASGNIYTTGYFIGTSDFNPSDEITNLTSAGGGDIFVQKLDSNGDFLWAHRFGETAFDEGRSIAVDAMENIYITGYFQGIADFDPGEETINLTSAGASDIFVQKLDTDGDFLWAKQIGGPLDDFGLSISLDVSENIYITGRFEGTADFDPGEAIVNLTSLEKGDIFIQKLDIDGDFIWAKQMKGDANDQGESLALDASGNIYITGWIQGTTDFDPYEGEHNITSIQSEDIFVLKLYPCYPTDPVPDITNLPEISAMCEVTIIDAPTPTATSNCVGTVTASANIDFPIIDQLITQIIWTYDDKNGNVITQDQAINWTPMDVTTSLSGTTITANNINGTYQWLDCENSNAPLSGETDQSFTATIDGSYAVEITENGCVDTSACISIIISSLSEFEHYEKLVAYPNPSSDNFKVEFGKVVKDAVLEVTDIHGKLVSTTQIQNSSEASIKLNETSGIYLLTIKSKEDLKTIRLIKE